MQDRYGAAVVGCGGDHDCCRRHPSVRRDFSRTDSTLPGSLWPFWRDLDLLRLLHDAAAGEDDPGDLRDTRDQHDVTSCRNELRLYLHALGNFSLWAVQMWDSSVRWPRGALGGELAQLGNFDECLGAGNGDGDADAPEMSLGGTLYCLPTLHVEPLQVQQGQHEHHWQEASRGSAWAVIKPPTHRLQIARNSLKWGMCLPPSCGGQHFAAVFNPSLQRLAAQHQLTATLQASPETCQMAEPKMRPSSVTFWNVVAVYFLWLLLCSALDCWYRYTSLACDNKGASRPRPGVPLVRAFSVRHHWQALVSTDPVDVVERDDISCIHGLRVIGILLVVIGHRAEAHGAGPLLNAGAIEEMYGDVLSIILLNGSVVVDVFFVVSGCVLCWTLMDRLQRGRVAIQNVYFYRYLRLTPAYLAAIAFLALGLPTLGSGPLWLSVAEKEAARCRERWWTNALYVNNLVRQDQPCMDPAWYLACDTQLFLLGTLLVRQLHEDVKKGVSLICTALLVAVLYPAFLTYQMGLDGTIIPDPSSLGHTAETPIHMHVYVSSLCRAGPYLVGILTAWWLRRQRNTRKVMTQARLLGLGVLLLSLSLFSVAASVLFYPPFETWTPRWFHALYAGTHRTLFAIPVAGLILACATRHLGWVSRALSSPRLRPLSRLSYCVFLIHCPVQIMSYGQQRAPYFFSTMDTVTLSLPDIVYSMLGAAVLHLSVEAPAMALIAMMKTKSTRRVPPEPESSSLPKPELKFLSRS